MSKKKKPNLKKELWKVFSQYIRQRDKGICFTCGLERHWKKMQAGHFINKAIGGLGLYFNERNVHCQCYRCNMNLGSNGAIYARRMKEVYGQEVLDELYEIYDNRKEFNISDEQYREEIKKYERLVEK